MVQDFIEISKEDIENIEDALNMNSDYRLKDSKFNIKSFEKGILLLCFNLDFIIFFSKFLL